MPQPSVVLQGFQSLRPKHRAEQGQALEWIAAAHARAETTLRGLADAAEREEAGRRLRKLVLRYGCSTDRIAARHSELDDFTHTDWERMRIFQLDRFPAGRPCGDRSLFYREASHRAFERFYAEDAEPPDVIMHVTCTGYVSPSGAQQLVAARDWGRRTEVVHAYHMGCYAALPAIRMAAGLVARGKDSVDLVHTELCTLHFDPSRHLPEQLVVQTLFADGMIRYRVARPGAEGPGLELLAAREEIVPGTGDAMTWMVSDFGMEMTLSRRVPDHIRTALGPYLERLGAEAGLGARGLAAEALFAIHPGGPRIIDEIAELLGLAPEQVQASNGILRDRGNMSSATLPHVWQALLEDPAAAPGRLVVALAFGPGLTISGAILRKRPAG
ncbi:MAG: 3-oxoacyl-[acyl-carrier-protein] synthase III C-terminal domain-containing protein [Holophaga sp.]|jgi:predicted naringenin-chalcone synthase